MKRDVKPGFHPAANNPGRARAPGIGHPTGSDGNNETNGWTLAVVLTERWLARSERVDSLLEQLTPGAPAQERARAQHLFYGVVRWAGRLESALAGLMVRAPRTKLRAVLLVTGFELMEGGAAVTAQVIHHAVEKAKRVASPAEARLVNAVARKMAGRLADTPATPAAQFSHPGWLVARWTAQLGANTTRSLLEWNQTPSPVYARWRSPASPPDFLIPTRWPGFYGMKPGHWDEVRQLADQGALYLQDPSTRLAVEMLAPQAHENVLDACAAPGGKSLLIADAMAGGPAGPGEEAVKGCLVALDEGGPRLERLKANLNHAPPSVKVALLPADLGRADAGFLRKHNLPDSFDAVLLDAPCTNTGVMRHRVDVKWRLRAGDFERHAAQQAVLLRAAAGLTRGGGRLVYSTCSLDPAENEAVVQEFLHDRPDWRLDRQAVASPWVEGHDGAAAFRLVRGPAGAIRPPDGFKIPEA